MFRFLRRIRSQMRFASAYDAGDWAAAISACETLLEDAPNDPKTHNDLGVAFLEAGHFERAERCFRRANELREHAIHHNNLGRALLAAGRHEASGAAFRRASELDPSDPQPRYNQTIWLRTVGRRDEAAEELRRFVAEFPNHAGGWNDLGSYWEEQGDREQALASYLRGATLTPGHLPVRLNLVRLMCEMERYPEATPHLRALATLGLTVQVRTTASELEIDIEGAQFYRGPIRS